MSKNSEDFDIFIIGGGINGVGIARDAAGRGLKVALAEMGDLGASTSSASTKLIHGGLRYLEYFEFGLVKDALTEREKLLSIMPHISWPLRFVLPYDYDMKFGNKAPLSKLLSIFMPWKRTHRAPWLIRLGLYIYDNVGGRRILPSTKSINLQRDISGTPLKKKYKRAFEYSDCWVDDSRLVILNARDAEKNGARVLTRSKVISTERRKSFWIITVKNTKSSEEMVFKSRILVNAAGPWVQSVRDNLLRINSPITVKLVKGSHIVTKKLYDHEKCYFFQGRDGRMVFSIPYESDFTLIGTTDVEHTSPDTSPNCSTEEKNYLINFVSEYFEKPISTHDIVWSYSGMRPLYDDGAKSASAISRDYFLELDKNHSVAPLINIYGGKITTYRKLAEAVLEKLGIYFPKMKGSWTANSSLPGGDFELDGFDDLVKSIKTQHPYLCFQYIMKLVRLYGTEVYEMLSNKKNKTDLGQELAKHVFSYEIDWSIKNEWVKCADDYIWRRTKLGLRLKKHELRNIEQYIEMKLIT